MSFDAEFGDAVERDQWGRRKLDLGDGRGKVGVTAVTTLAKTLDDNYNVHKWELRTVMKGLTYRPDIVAKLAGTDHTSKAGKKAFAEAAEVAKSMVASDEKANWGTAFHQLVQAHVEGRSDPARVPDELVQPLTNLLAELTRLNITLLPEFAERTCVCTSLATNGIFDYLGLLGDGRMVVIDIKTGNLDYLDRPTCIQLATYSRSDILMDGDTPMPMPQVDQHVGLMVHVDLNTGQPTVREMDLDAGWYAAVLSAKGRAWNRRDDIAWPYVPEQAAPFKSGPSMTATNYPVQAIDLASQALMWRAAEAADIAAESAGATVIHPTLDTAVITVPADPIIGTDSTGVQWEAPAGTTEEEAAAAGIMTATSLYGLLKKSKPKAQQLARKMGAPDIKLTQYGVNICKDILAHPNYSAYHVDEFLAGGERNQSVSEAEAVEASQAADALVDFQEPVSSDPAFAAFQDAAPHALSTEYPTQADRLTTATGDTPEIQAYVQPLSPQAQQIVANVESIQSTGAMPDPFAEATPVAGPGPVTESSLLMEVGQALSKSDLSIIWKKAMDAGIGWTGQLDSASKVRIKQF